MLQNSREAQVGLSFWKALPTSALTWPGGLELAHQRVACRQASSLDPIEFVQKTYRLG